MKFNFFYFACLMLAANFVNAQEEEEQKVKDSALEKRILQENIHAQAQGNNTFAFELYNRLGKTKGNLFFSPYSISAAMVLPYAGSAGATRSQIQTVMHYLAQDTNLYNAFSGLNSFLTTSQFIGPNESRLYLANSIWIQRDLKILPAFYQIASEYFKASLKQADFMRNPDSARLNINGWVQERTEGRIMDLLKSNDVDTSTRLVVVSSIFMKAVWLFPFDPSLTESATFFISPNASVSIPMMTRTSFFSLLQGNRYTLLEMPYRIDKEGAAQLSLLVFLPNENFELPQIESTILSSSLEGLMKNLERKQVIVSLPRFKLSQEFNLNQILQQMGLTLPFSSSADFSGITGNTELAINDVIHKAYLSIDEKGTEAVAATAVTIGLKAVQEETPIVFKADHPFLFMIIEKTTNSVLFIGRYVNPE